MNGMVQYCTNSSSMIYNKGVGYPAFKVTLETALMRLHEYGYGIRIGQTVRNSIEQLQVLNAWDNSNLPDLIKNGIIPDKILIEYLQGQRQIPELNGVLLSPQDKDIIFKYKNLWSNIQVSPAKSGLFIDVQVTSNPQKYQALEQKYHEIYGV